MKTELGKIVSFEIRDIDGRFGVYITLGGKGWGVLDTNTVKSINLDEYCTVTTSNCKEIMNFINRTMSIAKVSRMSDLIGKPIEAKFNDGYELVSWRILDEVL